VTVLPLRTLAPAKVNLGLFLGPPRADGKHELVTVMQSISLADELTLEYANAAPGDVSGDAAPVDAAPSGAAPSGAPANGAGEDQVVCPAVPGPPEENLAAVALRMFRQATGWDVGPLRLSIVKRIPVAAGLGGGSADAAAALRLAGHASGLGSDELLLELAARLGADVPAQIAPGRWLATGAGEHLCELPAPNPTFGVLVLAAAAGLSTAAVYAEADRLGLGHTPQALEQHRRAVAAALELGAPVPTVRELVHNDLQQAALSLCPAIADALAEAQEAGADLAFVSGSGPTVVGVFPRANGLGAARRAADGLAGREPAPICAAPVDSTFARVVPSGSHALSAPHAAREAG
jgi:4-diphosphocytidyl-2-C-methyl-D-erythritol kinase